MVGPVKLSSLAELKEERGPTEIERLNRQRIVTILGNPETIDLSEATNRTNAIVQGLQLPPQYTPILSGQAKTLQETLFYLLVAFGMSFTFMYLILAAQFESWSQPVSILMALPVTIPFGLLSLVLFRTPMDLYAMFGAVHAGGHRQEERHPPGRRHEPAPRRGALQAGGDPGGEPHAAAADPDDHGDAGGRDVVPIALGRGPGSGARASMAKVIIGGQLLSLLLALVVTPVSYSLLDSAKSFARRLRRGGRGPHHRPTGLTAPAGRGLAEARH